MDDGVVLTNFDDDIGVVDLPGKTPFHYVICREPHPDGTACEPEWDGYGYICSWRLMRALTG